MSGQSAPAALSDPGAFSYAVLDPDAEAVARDAADIIHGVQKAFTLEVGRQLLRAKDILPHGAFERWVRDMLDMKPRTARNHMNAARWLHGKPATVADLPPTILYALSAPTAAAEVVQSVVTAAAAGEPLNAKAIDMLLLTAKQEASDLKVAQRRNPNVTQADLKARKERQRSRDAAEDKRHADEEAKAKRDREDRVQPLAIAIATLGQDQVAELLDVLFRWNDVQALADALREVAP